MDAFTFPFKFVSGKVSKVDVTTERYIAQKVASVISTRTGELELNPLFGTSSPEFDEFDSAGLAYTCGQYFPEVTLEKIYQTINDEGRLTVEVAFQTNIQG